MTTAQMAVYIGKKAHIPVGELRVEVQVTDVKERWGNLRFEVRPTAGFGRMWTERIEFQKEVS